MAKKSDVKTQTVHFTVDADFITGHARNLWSEASYEKAFSFLETVRGISKTQMAMVIMGELKFEELGDTQTFTLVHDDWKFDPSRCHLGLYPDPLSKKEMAAARKVLDEQRRKEQVNQICGRLLDKAGEYHPALRYIQNLVFQYDRDGDFVFFMQKAQEFLQAREFVDEERGLAKELMAFIEGQNFNDEIKELAEAGEKPRPAADVTPNGIITPAGDFYRCEFAGHNVLAVALGYESDPPDEPATTAVKAGCIVLSANLVNRKCRVIREKMTDTQHEKFKQWFGLTFNGEIQYVEVDE